MHVHRRFMDGKGMFCIVKEEGGRMNEPDNVPFNRTTQDPVQLEETDFSKNSDVLPTQIFSLTRHTKNSQLQEGSWDSLLNWLDISPDALVIVNQADRKSVV